MCVSCLFEVFFVRCVCVVFMCVVFLCVFSVYLCWCGVCYNFGGFVVGIFLCEMCGLCVCVVFFLVLVNCVCVGLSV